MEKAQIILDPALLLIDERMKAANIMTGEGGVLFLTVMAGSIVSVEARDNDKSPLPSIIMEEIKRDRRRGRRVGGNKFQRDGVIAFHLNLHDMENGKEWRRRPWEESVGFFDENIEDVDWAIHFAARNKGKGYPISFIGGCCLSVIKDWGGSMLEAEKFFKDIFNKNLQEPAVVKLLDLTTNFPVKNKGKQKDELLEVMKVTFEAYKNRTGKERY